MKKYVALIMRAEDFGVGIEEGESIEDILMDGYLEKENWVHGYEFECPDSFDEETVTLIARGYFWENDWTMQDTISCILRDQGDLPEGEDSSEEDPDPVEVDTDAVYIKASVS